MHLFNQMSSFCRTISEIYPSWTIYLEHVPAEFERPCFCLAMEKPSDRPLAGMILASSVTWRLTYYGTTLEDVLGVVDTIAAHLMDPGVIPYFDYSESPETSTDRLLRVGSMETVIELALSEDYNAVCRVSSELRVPRDRTEAPYISGVHATPSLTGR